MPISPEKTSNDKARTQALLLEYKASGSLQAREELVMLHQKLVRFIASKFAGRGEPVEDLYQVGLIGLVKAIERYDTSFGAQFTTFAMPTIMGEIKRHFRDHGSALKLSRLITELKPAVAREIERHTQQTGVVPTAAIIAAKLKVTEERVLEVLEASRTQCMVSLDAPRNQAGESNLDGLGGTDDQLIQVENQMMVQAAMGALSDRDRTIIYRRFFQLQSQAEVAKEIGVSQMQICRLERSALARMRKQLERVAA